MLKAGIHGCFTTACIPASPTTNCPGLPAPKIAGTAIQRERMKTAMVVASPTQRIESSFPRGMIGSARSPATMAGRKRMSVRGQNAGCVTAKVGAIPMGR